MHIAGRGRATPKKVDSPLDSADTSLSALALSSKSAPLRASIYPPGGGSAAIFPSIRVASSWPSINGGSVASRR